MSYYEPDDYDNYYEPSELDTILDEYKDKCKSVLLSKIQSEIKSLREENETLKSKNDIFQKRESEITKKERELKYQAENIERDVKNKFYKETIEDTVNNMVEGCNVWYASNEAFQKPKCNTCNKDRKLVAKFPDGTESIKDCKCSKLDYSYIPMLSELRTIKLTKYYSDYSNDRKFYLNSYREPNEDSHYSYDNYGSADFKITHIYEKFDDSVIEYHGNKSYGECLGFKTKEECQKYCDWLNSNNKKVRSVPTSPKCAENRKK